MAGSGYDPVRHLHLDGRAAWQCALGRDPVCRKADEPDQTSISVRGAYPVTTLMRRVLPTPTDLKEIAMLIDGFFDTVIDEARSQLRAGVGLALRPALG